MTGSTTPPGSPIPPPGSPRDTSHGSQQSPFGSTPNAERYLLEADSLRRRQLRSALLHGSGRTWRDRRRIWPAVLAGVVLTAIVSAAIAVTGAFHDHRRQQQEQQREQERQLQEVDEAGSGLERAREAVQLLLPGDHHESGWDAPPAGRPTRTR